MKRSESMKSPFVPEPTILLCSTHLVLGMRKPPSKRGLHRRSPLLTFLSLFHWHAALPWRFSVAPGFYSALPGLLQISTTGSCLWIPLKGFLLNSSFLPSSSLEASGLLWLLPFKPLHLCPDPWELHPSHLTEYWSCRRPWCSALFTAPAWPLLSSGVHHTQNPSGLPTAYRNSLISSLGFKIHCVLASR